MNTAVPEPGLSAAAGLLETLLEVSLSAVIPLRPRHGPAGEPLDFALDYLNPAAQRPTGLPARPAGTVRPDFFDAPADEVLAFCRRVFATGAAGRHELRQARNGRANWLRLAARRVVEQREESFRLMADNAPALLWVTDPTGYCTYLNQPRYDYTGQSVAAALSLGRTGAVHPDAAGAAGAAFVDANARRGPFKCLYRLRRRDGRYRWATDTGLPHFTAAGEYAGMVGTVIDVHEQQLAELALQRRTKQLRKSRDEAQEFSEQQLFAMFQRYHTHVEGSGVGLYMVKRLVENAGGRVEVHSQLGQGSTFSVYFKR